MRHCVLCMFFMFYFFALVCETRVSILCTVSVTRVFACLQHSNYQCKYHKHAETHAREHSCTHVSTILFHMWVNMISHRTKCMVFVFVFFMPFCFSVSKRCFYLCITVQCWRAVHCFTFYVALNVNLIHNVSFRFLNEEKRTADETIRNILWSAMRSAGFCSFYFNLLQPTLLEWMLSIM